MPFSAYGYAGPVICCLEFFYSGVNPILIATRKEYYGKYFRFEFSNKFNKIQCINGYCRAFLNIAFSL